MSGSVDFREVRLGVVRGITYAMWGGAGVFMPAVRNLGARTVRIYVYWSQVEPDPGRFTWDTVDAFLAQLEPDDEAWVTVSSASTWATERATPFLPPSPAKDRSTYAEFVFELVRHCGGRVRFWQCDNEPSVAFLWAGTIEAYLSQLHVFHESVGRADPDALVVLGGATPNASGVSGPGPGGPSEVQYFDRLLQEGGADFDVLDIHLYGDPYVIPETIARWRGRLAAFGLDKPIVAGEYGGPLLFQFPEASRALFSAMGPPRIGDPVETAERNEDGSAEGEAPGGNPDEPAVVALYTRMAEMPPQLQMFMAGCPADLDAKRHRIAARELVMRNVLAVACGVRRTLAWNLAPEVYGKLSPYHIHNLLFDTLKLMDYQGEIINRRYPAADALARLTTVLSGVDEISRMDVLDRPDVFAFEVRRAGRGPCVIAWVRRDEWTGEDEPPVPVALPWTGDAALAIDTFGSPVAAEVCRTEVRLGLTLTPVFIER